MSTPTSPVMLITGGTGSIGSEVARQALAAGWSVVVQGSREESVAAVVETLENQYPDARVCGLTLNIKSSSAAVEEMVAKAVESFNGLNAVVDCLVTGPVEGRLTGAFTATTPAAYAEFSEYSIVYLQRLAHAALPRLTQTKGCFIAFTSDAGIFAAPNQTMIATARAAVVSFVRNLALEVARDGVRIHCISPGFVDQTRTADRLAATGPKRIDKARKRAGLGLPTPADIAPAVIFLCGDGAKRMTGQVISINGGMNA